MTGFRTWSCGSRLDRVDRPARLVACFERHPTRTFVVVGLLFALAYVTAQVWFAKPPGRVIDGDALKYYAWLRSVAFDGDIDFSNDYRLLTDELAEDSKVLTPLATGLVPNSAPPGSALLWAPLFLAVTAIVGVLNLLGAQIPFDGLALPFKISAGVAGIGYATAGVWLCYELARRIYPAAAAFWATLTLWLAGPLLYYSLVSPTYSHATSLFAVALFALAWYQTRDRDDLRRFALLGALAGLAGLVRSQDLIILIVPGIELLAGIWERRWSLVAACGRLAVVGATCTLVLAPQLWAWQVIYGTPVLNPHGGGGFFEWTRPAILQTLFSMRQGLVSWTPVVMLAALGLPWLLKRDRLLGWVAVVTLILALYSQRVVGQVVGRSWVRGTPLRQLHAVSGNRTVGVPGIPRAGVPDGARAHPLHLPNWEQCAFPAPVPVVHARLPRHRPRIP